MWRFVRASLPVAIFALVTIAASPAWATNFGGDPVPGPAAGILAGGAIIGAIVAAKWWRRK